MRSNVAEGSVKVFLVAAVFLASLGLAACGGSGSTPNTNPTTATQSVTLSTSATVVQLPPVANFTETLNLPAATTGAGATLASTITTQLPSGLPAPTERGPGGSPSPRTQAATAPTPIVFLQLTNNTGSTVVLSAYPGFSVTTAGTTTFPSGTYEVEVEDAASAASGWQIIGTAVLATPTLTFTGPQSGFTLPAGDTVTLALVAAPSSLSGAITLSPTTSAAAPYALAPGGNVTISGVENGYSGSFTAVSGNTAVATVAQGAAANQFVVTGVATGNAMISVTSSASSAAAVFYVTVTAPSVSTFTIALPEKQGQAVAIPTAGVSNLASGAVTFPVAPTGHDYPAGTVITVTVSNSVPPGFGFATPAQQVFGITFTSNQTLTPLTLPALPALTVSLNLAPQPTQPFYLDGEVLLPLAPFSTSCSVTGVGGTTNGWNIGAQGEPQGLTAGTASGYDFFYGNSICLP